MNMLLSKFGMCFHSNTESSLREFSAREIALRLRYSYISKNNRPAKDMPVERYLLNNQRLRMFRIFS